MNDHDRLPESAATERREAFASRNVERDGPFFKVRTERCATCIFGQDSPLKVAPERMAGLVRDWKRSDTFQICHSHAVGVDGEEVDGEVVACRGWWETNSCQLSQVAERMGVVAFVPAPEEPVYSRQDADQPDSEEPSVEERETAK